MKTQAKRLWDLPTAVILLMVLFTSALRLTVTDWTPRLGIVGMATILATTLGLALGFSLFKRRSVFLLASAYSLIMVPWQLTLTLDGEIGGLQRLTSLFGRLGFTINQVGSRQPVQDPIFFLALMTILFWTISLIAGYYLVRHGNLLAALIPSGVAIIIFQIFDSHNPQRIWLIAQYIFLLLLLLGRINYIRSRQDWRSRGVHMTIDSGFDLNTGILVSAAVVILVAWTLPTNLPYSHSGTSLWREITEPFESLRNRLSDAFAATSGAPPVGFDFYGEHLPLGRNVYDGEEVIFSVMPPVVSDRPVRYYWRTRVYDVYEDGFWSTSSQNISPFLPEDGDLSIPDIDERLTAEFTFVQQLSQQSTYFTAAQPVWVSRAAELVSFSNSTSELDLVTIRAEPILRAGDAYRVRSALLNPTISELRRAGEDYPEWVLERYLQIPDNLPPRVRELALELTGNRDNPYDKAAAITAFLRNEISYTTSVPAPPPNRDMLDWLLFTWKRGFCNYYATAEVILLRAAGVPARMAVGFAEGTSQIDGSFAVQQRDAHAWPEVYFPGYGWVEFEPTVIQPVLVRPTGSQILIPGIRPNQPAIPDEQPADDGFSGSGLNNPANEPPVAPEAAINLSALILWITLPAGLAILGILAWRWNRRSAFTQRLPQMIVAVYRRRGWETPSWLESWLQRSLQSPIERSFEVINRSLRQLHQPAPPHATPAERAAVLAELVPAARTAIETLASEHQTTLYSPKPGDPERARSASHTIRYQTFLTIITRWLFPSPKEPVRHD